MRRTISITVFVVICLTLVALVGWSQGPEDWEYYKGSTLNRARNTMSGNLVRTVFYNYGLTGNIGEISGEWPIGTGNEYVGDVSPLVGIEFVHPSGDTLRSVLTSDGPRGNPDGPPGGGTFWGFEPLPGFAALPAIGEDPKVAMSNQPLTWPDFWPDKYVNDPNDPTWRIQSDRGWRGSWNGYFGKNVTNADQETYFVTDDQADMEWFERSDSLGNVYRYYPNPEDSARRGLGIRVSVRGLQWAHFLAQDCIFWLYDITNISSYTYNKVAFGMVVGTLSGGRQDSRDDLAYFDLGYDITYSWDSDDQGSAGWIPVRPGEINVGYVGYAFLESPGNPYDGIDNDGDVPSPSYVLEPSDFQARSYNVGNRLFLINYSTFERIDTTMPTQGISFTAYGRQFNVYPGQMLEENGRNNIDDNLNGLIDERIEDHLGLTYKDYFNNRGLDNLLIDEARDDGIDNDGDWDPLTDDVGADGVPATGDYGEGDGLPTNGEPHFDRTDVDESDQIGLTSFEYFSPPGAVRMRDDAALWTRMEPGHFDVTPNTPEDGDFIYGSGYFPLRPGQTERFSMALLYGEDFADLTENKITVQQVYDENYNFARPPEKPTAWVVPGDGRVTLYWDDVAESSLDPVSGYDFEGYKIYRATDPNFREVFSITDGFGRRVFHRPIAQFDLINEYEGFFPIIRNAVIVYLGANTGLQHSWTDTTVENGQTYYYAVVAYDHGDIEKAILPAENNKTIVVDEAGNVTLDKNTLLVTPRAPAAGYQEPRLSSVAHVGGFSTGMIGVEALDPREIQDDRQYDFRFSAQPSDTPSVPSHVEYHVLRQSDGQTDTLIGGKLLVPEPNLLPQADPFAAYYDSLFNLPPGTYDPALYFTVAGTQVFDGQRAYMLLPRDVKLIPQASGWADTSRHLYSYRFTKASLWYQGYQIVTGVAYPSDYHVEWYEGVVDTSTYLNFYNLLIYPARPVNFRVKNLNRNEYIEFGFIEQAATTNGVVDPGEVILFLENDTLVTWALEFRRTVGGSDSTRPDNGDDLQLRLYQPYSDADVYRYTTRAARVDPGAVNLDRIRVYPNPYVAVSAQEPANRYGEGRGERRISFIHLPDRCTIRIYTVRGDLVETIEHLTTIDDGMESWDLRSRDGLNVAYGVYLYHIDSPYGEKIGRFAVIK
ncbi:hypothetical protein KKH27_00755 [bacterium]|nr:hypothetical protein [bacterium]MBU1984411.1 hypothetical protein [bacterium]